MSVQVKICGISTSEAMAAAVEAGAALVGLVFYPPSPRAVTPAQGAVLAQPVPPRAVRPGRLVHADAATIAPILDAVPLALLQIHGTERPQPLAALPAPLRLRSITGGNL